MFGFSEYPEAKYGPNTCFILTDPIQGFHNECTFEVKVSAKLYYKDKEMDTRWNPRSEWWYRVEYTKIFSNLFYNTFEPLEPFKLAESEIGPTLVH